MKSHLLTTLLILAVATVTSAGSLQRKAISLRTGNEIPFSDLVPTVCDINSDATGASATYRIENVILEPDSLYQGSYKCVIDEFTNSDITSAPAYPLRKDYIQLPFGCDSATVSVTNASFQELSYELAPAYPFCIGEKIPVFTKKHVPPITQCDFGTQSDIVSMEIIDHLDQTYAVITVNPCQYNSIDKRIRVYTDFEVRINYGNIDHAKIARRNEAKMKLHSSYKAAMQKAQIGIGVPLIPNYDSIYCPPIEVDDGPVYKYYLIVTSDRLLEAANEFAVFKRKMGFIPHVTSRTTWTPDQIQDSINSYLHYRRQIQQGYPSSIDVIIIGGHSDVPAKKITLNVLDSETMQNTPKSFITDYYYSCYTGSDTRVVILGRIPANSIEDARNAINKIKNYSLNPTDDENFYTSAAHISVYDGGVREKLPYIHCSETCRDIVLNLRKDFNVARLYYAQENISPEFCGDYDSEGYPLPDELKRPNYAWDADKYAIASELNNGCIYAFYRGHGDNDRFENPRITSEDITNGILQNGNKLPIFLNFTCLSGNFEVPKSLTERLLTYPNGGGVGAIAATVATNSYANNSISQKLITNWIKRSKNETHSQYPSYNYIDIDLGDIFDEAFFQVPDLTSDALAFHKAAYHLFGDPSMLICTRPPREYTDGEVWCQPHYDANTNKLKYIEVLINLVDDEACYIAIEDKETHETTLACGSNVFFPQFNPQKQSMTIYGLNRIPLEVNAPESGTTIIDTGKMLTFAPNPASSTCLIGYHITTSGVINNQALLYITNVSTGKCVDKILVKGHIGRIELDVSNYPNGIYAVSMTTIPLSGDTGAPIIGRGKMIVQH